MGVAYRILLTSGGGYIIPTTLFVGASFFSSGVSVSLPACGGSGSDRPTISGMARLAPTRGNGQRVT